MDLSQKKVGDIVEIDGKKMVITNFCGTAAGLAPYAEVKGVSKIIEGLEEVEAPKKKRGK